MTAARQNPGAARAGIPVRLSDIERACAYLDSITGTLNPEQHAAMWFAEARAQGEAEGRAAERERCARMAENGCLVPPDGGSPTESEQEMCKSIAAFIRHGSDEGLP